MLGQGLYSSGYDTGEFVDLFITSGLAARFEKGDFAVTVGMSGAELTYLVLNLTKHQVERETPRYTMNRGKEYWEDWALAHYQWERALSIEEIIEYLSIAGIVRMHSP